MLLTVKLVGQAGEEGRSLHCLELLGRQLICALHALHPAAVLAFADRQTAKAA